MFPSTKLFFAHRELEAFVLLRECWNENTLKRVCYHLESLHSTENWKSAIKKVRLNVPHIFFEGYKFIIDIFLVFIFGTMILRFWFFNIKKKFKMREKILNLLKAFKYLLKIDWNPWKCEVLWIGKVCHYWLCVMDFIYSSM